MKVFQTSKFQRLNAILNSLPLYSVYAGKSSKSQAVNAKYVVAPILFFVGLLILICIYLRVRKPTKHFESKFRCLFNAWCKSEFIFSHAISYFGRVRSTARIKMNQMFFFFLRHLHGMWRRINGTFLYMFYLISNWRIVLETFVFAICTFNFHLTNMAC